MQGISTERTGTHSVVPALPWVRRVQLRVKRALDVSVSLLLLIAMCPLLLAIAAAIAASSRGPVLFRQARLGMHGAPFKILKFRTMVVGAPDVRNVDGSTFSGARDPRITPIGRFLRKTSLDELPQLVNVLRGEMSLVGPRPDLVSQVSAYEPAERRKLDMRPGITGWAMVRGRNAIPWSMRKSLDVEYVDRFSLGFDLWILVRTIPAVLFGVGVVAPEADADSQDSPTAVR